MPALFLIGVLIWTLLEYVIHRYVFHYEPKTRVGKLLHFIMHGVHHDYPNDATATGHAAESSAFRWRFFLRYVSS